MNRIKKTLSTIILILCTLSLFSQDNWSGYRVGELFPGYVIKTDGTRLDGYIEAQLLAAPEDNLLVSCNQNKVIFYADPKNKKSKIVFKPNELQEYKIIDKLYHSIPYSGGLSSTALRFVLLTSEGKIAQYTWYDNVGSLMYPAYETKTIIRKGMEKPFEITTLILNFSKKVSTLVEDYEDLKMKIINKEDGYNYFRILEIIKEYNEWYLNRNSN